VKVDAQGKVRFNKSQAKQWWQLKKVFGNKLSHRTLLDMLGKRHQQQRAEAAAVTAAVMADYAVRASAMAANATAAAGGGREAAAAAHATAPSMTQNTAAGGSAAAAQSDAMRQQLGLAAHQRGEREHAARFARLRQATTAAASPTARSAQQLPLGMQHSAPQQPPLLYQLVQQQPQMQQTQPPVQLQQPVLMQRPGLTPEQVQMAAAALHQQRAHVAGLTPQQLQQLAQQQHVLLRQQQQLQQLQQLHTQHAAQKHAQALQALRAQQEQQQRQRHHHHHQQQQVLHELMLRRHAAHQAAQQAQAPPPGLVPVPPAHLAAALPPPQPQAQQQQQPPQQPQQQQQQQQQQQPPPGYGQRPQDPLQQRFDLAKSKLNLSLAYRCWPPTLQAAAISLLLRFVRIEAPQIRAAQAAGVDHNQALFDVAKQRGAEMQAEAAGLTSEQDQAQLRSAVLPAVLQALSASTGYTAAGAVAAVEALVAGRQQGGSCGGASGVSAPAAVAAVASPMPADPAAAAQFPAPPAARATAAAPAAAPVQVVAASGLSHKRQLPSLDEDERALEATAAKRIRVADVDHYADLVVGGDVKEEQRSGDAGAVAGGSGSQQAAPVVRANQARTASPPPRPQRWAATEHTARRQEPQHAGNAAGRAGRSRSRSRSSSATTASDSTDPGRRVDPASVIDLTQDDG